MKKWQIKEIYIKYLWEKCSLSMYYHRIKMWIDPLEALKPIEKKQYEVRSKKFTEELERYKKQKQPKPPRQRFYWRLQKWYTKEEAIKIPFISRDKKQRWCKELYVKAYTVKERMFKQDDFEIRITYKQDEAKVFKDAYERMIDEAENQIYRTDDIIESKELRSKLEKLVDEYAIFISYNS